MIFVESVAFTGRLQSLAHGAEVEVLATIQRDLLLDPLRGDLVKATGGLRKARVANPVRQKGRRGGFRYLYLYLGQRDHIHLLYLLDKNEQADLSAAERRSLRTMIERIKNLELRAH